MQQNSFVVLFSVCSFCVFLFGCNSLDDDPCTGVNYKARTLSGIVNCDATLDAGHPWILKEGTVVGKGFKEITQDTVQEIKNDGVTLTIEAGVEIFAEPEGALLISRGSKIMAEGTADNPITFSSVDEGTSGSGEWGGVFIQGFAPYYERSTNKRCSEESFCNPSIDAGYKHKAKFGGDDPADSSGVLRYVRIAEAGYLKVKERKSESLGLHSVGHGTKIEYIQVQGGLEDGIKLVGGTVNLKYGVLTNNEDDDISLDHGYQGHLQHFLMIKNQSIFYPAEGNSPRGIEANNSTTKSVKATNIKVANVTVIGSDLVRTDGPFDPALKPGAQDMRKQPGIYLRGDITAEVSNSVVTGFNDCLRVEHGAEDATRVQLNNIITGDCEDDSLSVLANKLVPGSGIRPEPFENNIFHLDQLKTFVEYDANLALTSPLSRLDSLTEFEHLSGRDEFSFDKTDYIGGVDPSKPEGHWYQGWIFNGSTIIDKVSE
ncbi:MAG: hypothetical protein OXE99_07910 [Cellvibrionales bacterium]|nr:hypothetical protein [Cellvibrionales bacterium]